MKFEPRTNQLGRLGEGQIRDASPAIRDDDAPFRRNIVGPVWSTGHSSIAVVSFSEKRKFCCSKWLIAVFGETFTRTTVPVQYVLKTTEHD